MRAPKRVLAIATAVGCATAIAACGSSSKSSTAVASSHNSQGLKFSACMRSHGVSGFPDPSPGGGIHIQAGSGINPFSPSFKEAQGSCFKLLPGGGPPGPGNASAQQKAQALKTSECMRSHGITGFPDPTTTPPSNPAGYSAILDRGGVVTAIPNSINPASPVFNKAAAACGFPH